MTRVCNPIQEVASSCRAIAVILSIDSHGIDHLDSLVSDLASIDVESYLVANGRKLHEALKAKDIEHVTSYSNPGFGASISHAVELAGSWDWLLVVNDDIEIRPPQLKESMASVYKFDPNLQSLHYFDAEPFRNVPGPWSTFISLSLIGGVVKRLNLSRSVAAGPKRLPAYKSFSFVAISKAAWSQLHGFDPSIIFGYEDSDFARRLHPVADAIIDLHASGDSGVTHLHSVSGKRHIASVLPVSAWSAFQYLQKWDTTRFNARLICTAALVVRVILVPFVSASKVAHLAGIRTSIKVLWGNRAPSLPLFEDL